MKKIILCSIMLGLTQTIWAQRLSTGLDFDDAAHSKTLVKKMNRNRGLLLTQTSLKPYCPTPQQQGEYPNCVGWSIGYAACTISEAVLLNIRDKKQLDQMATSPMYVYALGKPKRDKTCDSNAKIDSALSNLKQIGGIPRHQAFNELCLSPNQLPTHISEGVRIVDFMSLFKETDSKIQKLYLIKQALSHKKPVVAAIKAYESLKQAKKVWSGDLSHYIGGHAICIVGYDDDLEGGSVEIMNSWGTEWGDKGFTMIRYKDLDTILKYAFELTIDKCAPVKTITPTLAPALPTSQEPFLTSTIGIQLNTGAIVPIEATQKANRTANPLDAHYRTIKGYGTGTKYQVLLDYSEQLYLYVLGSDLTGQVSKLFPANDSMSALLSNPNAPLVLPNEDWHIELDDNEGKEYFYFLYSKTELPIDVLLTQWNAQTGTAAEKIYKTYQSQLQPFAPSNPVENKIRFQSKFDSKNLILVVLEMEHL